jgi:hypothetical protein
MSAGNMNELSVKPKHIASSLFRVGDVTGAA